MPTGRKAKYLYEKERSPYWWYRFTLEGYEYRGSTQCKEAKAAADFVEALRVEIRKDIAATMLLWVKSEVGGVKSRSVRVSTFSKPRKDAHGKLFAISGGTQSTY